MGSEPFGFDDIVSIQRWSAVEPLGRAAIAHGPTRFKLPPDARLALVGTAWPYELEDGGTARVWRLNAATPHLFRLLAEAARGLRVIPEVAPLPTPAGFADPVLDHDGIVWKTAAALADGRARQLRELAALLDEADAVVLAFGAIEFASDRATGIALHDLTARGAATRLPGLDEVVDDVSACVRALGDRAVVLCVDPAPIERTLEPAAVVEIDTLSKATLRLAVDRVRAAFPRVDYFPLWEASRLGSSAKPRPSAAREALDAFAHRFGMRHDESAGGTYMNRLCDPERLASLLSEPFDDDAPE